MLPPFKYRPLDVPLSLRAVIYIEQMQDNQLHQDTIAFRQIIRPAEKQGWSDYCLLLERNLPEHTPTGDNPADELVRELARPLLRLEVVLDAKGHPLKLRNQTEIWERWQNQLYPALHSAYAGEWVDAMLNKTETLLLHPDRTLQAALHRDWILSHYLEPIRRAARVENTPFLFYLAGETPLAFREQWQYYPETGEQQPCIEISGRPAAPIPPDVLRWLLPEAVRQKADAAGVSIEKQGIHWLDPARGLWGAGFEYQYFIRAGSGYRKQVRLQLISD